ncbi:ParM/StbA family protein [Salibacterium aidingense]|uniref:ParM/StbA family protein n=1 Tax=Salibacterium aidingense TaxID=384933 RepID=UPI00040A1306|nr:ParM/StbA family protein [Salibacterium aidingense]
MNQIEKLFEDDVLITGIDQGNKSAKFSYLNRQGNIESFAIPTVIAPAQTRKTSLEGAAESHIIEKRLHLKIESKSLSLKNQERYVYVGHFARNKPDKEEPTYEHNGGEGRHISKTKFSNDLHIVTTLAGLAVMAAKTNKDTVRIPYAGGLPVSEIKEYGSEKALESVKGTHHITFIDGPMEGKTIKVVIDSGKMYGEGAITDLSLNFDVQQGELLETSLNGQLADNYALGDLGAGTSDVIIFTDDGIDGNLSKSLDIEGTNPYIDRMIEKVNNMEEYTKLKDLMGLDDDAKVYQSREDFMNEVIEPGITAWLHNEQQETPTFEVKLMKKRIVDITHIVMEELKDYAEKHKKELSKAWNDAGVEDLVIVGGGVLFGYPEFKKVQEQFRELQGEDWAIFPENIEKAPFFTSRGYLIANYLRAMSEQAEVTS